jgi:hypothetical protein
MLKNLLDEKTTKEKVLIIGLIVIVLSIYSLTNWIIYRLLAFFIGKILSIMAIAITYYLSLRSLVRMLSFPGITIWMKRTLEFDFCKRTASQVLRNATDLKIALESFMGPG